MVEQTTFIEDNEKGVATHLEDSSYKGYEESRPSAFDEEQERILTKRVLRKLDVRALPMLAILFLFSFLDRYVERPSRVRTITDYHGVRQDEHRKRKGSGSAERPETHQQHVLELPLHFFCLLHSERG
jgi:hypothetical protein